MSEYTKEYLATQLIINEYKINFLKDPESVSKHTLDLSDQLGRNAGIVTVFSMVNALVKGGINE